jgi:hypothetical protein
MPCFPSLWASCVLLRPILQVPLESLQDSIPGPVWTGEAVRRAGCPERLNGPGLKIRTETEAFNFMTIEAKYAAARGQNHSMSGVGTTHPHELRTTGTTGDEPSPPRSWFRGAATRPSRPPVNAPATPGLAGGTPALAPGAHRERRVTLGRRWRTPAGRYGFSRKRLILASAASLLLNGCVVHEYAVRPVPVVVPPPPAAVVVQPPEAPEIVVASPPPAPLVETVTVSPAVGFVWIPGAWAWHAGWVWERGYWARPPFLGARWVPHRYVYRNGAHVVIRGGWQR